MELENLFLGSAMEMIDAEGKVKLVGPGKVWAKNLLNGIIEKDQNIVVVQCRKSKNFYIYALAD